MNVVQALAVAAAALALSGDLMGASLPRAGSQLTSLLARGEALAHRIAAQTSRAVPDGDGCSENKAEETPRSKGEHTLPDTSIHVAVSAARL